MKINDVHDMFRLFSNRETNERTNGLVKRRGKKKRRNIDMEQKNQRLQAGIEIPNMFSYIPNKSK